MALFKASPPPAPDYSGITAANKEAAEVSAQVARENLAWAKETYQRDYDFQKEQWAAIRPMIDQQTAASQRQQERYYQTFAPIEDKLAAEAMNYDTPERREQERARAVADASMAGEAQRKNATQNLQAFGIDPSMTRSQALDNSLRTQQAAMQAGAANMATRGVEDKARALQMAAVDIGKGFPSQALAAANYATGATGANIQSQLATSQFGAGAMGNPTQWQQLSIGANNAANSLIGSVYGTQANIYGTQQRAMSGFMDNIFEMAGTGIGAMSMPGRPSDERIKENIRQVGKLDNGLPVYEFNFKGDDGRPQIGLLAQDVEKTKPEAVTESPGGVKLLDYGQATRPDAGQQQNDDGSVSRTYAIPEDIVMRKGTEFFDRLVDKTRNPKPKQDRTAAVQAPSQSEPLPQARTALPQPAAMPQAASLPQSSVFDALMQV